MSILKISSINDEAVKMKKVVIMMMIVMMMVIIMIVMMMIGMGIRGVSYEKGGLIL